MLPGLDDGAASLEESVDLAREAAIEGVHTVVATPHIREDYDVPIAELPERVSSLSQHLEEREVPVRVTTGGEVGMYMAARLDDDALRAVSLGGGGRYVLYELPYGPHPPRLEEALFELALRGFVPVIAHPERHEGLRRDISLVAELVRRGVLMQLTASALTTEPRREVTRFALELVDRRLAHCIGSDRHGAAGRPGLRAARRALEERGRDSAIYAERMTVDIPAAILAGESVPVERPRERPGRSTPRWWPGGQSREER